MEIPFLRDAPAICPSFRIFLPNVRKVKEALRTVMWLKYRIKDEGIFSMASQDGTLKLVSKKVVYLVEAYALFCTGADDKTDKRLKESTFSSTGEILAAYFGWYFVDASSIKFFTTDSTLNESKTLLKEVSICYTRLEGVEHTSKHYKYRNSIPVTGKSLPIANRDVKPLDCRTNSSSLGSRGQVEQGKLERV